MKSVNIVAGDDIELDLRPFLIRYTDGRIQRLLASPFVAASENATGNRGVATRDVVIDGGERRGGGRVRGVSPRAGAPDTGGLRRCVDHAPVGGVPRRPVARRPRGPQPDVPRRRQRRREHRVPHSGTGQPRPPLRRHRDRGGGHGAPLLLGIRAAAVRDGLRRLVDVPGTPGGLALAIRDGGAGGQRRPPAG